MHRLLVVALMLALTAASAAADERTMRMTPPRLGFVEGDVSFWRPGVGDWEAAQLNLPLAAGDALASRAGQFELQIGRQSFARAGDDTQVRVSSLEPDFLQLSVTQGSVVLDLRGLAAGRLYQVDTPHGAATVTRDGFYRLDVGADATRVTVRRGGRASFTPAGGDAVDLSTGEAMVASGGAVGQLSLEPAPAFDEWDRWNYARADEYLAAPRSEAVAVDVYGAAELERHGGWRYERPYGRVWVPYGVPAGWAPYSNGRWLYDPLYGWSWVDYAPWGWAPFHYGRWVYAGYWAWAPGPVLATSYYAPALVSFLFPPVAIGIGFGPAWIGWTPLGWGEPLVPWWGGRGFIGAPCWYGWGGPRVVNNIVINTGDTINADSIKLYRNARVPGGIVGVPKDKFGMPDMHRSRLGSIPAGGLKPVHGAAPTAGGRAAASAAAKAPLPDFGSRRPAPSGAGAAAAAGFTRRAPQAARAAADGSASRGPAYGAAPKPAAGDAPFDRLRTQSRGAPETRAAAPQPATTRVRTSDLRRGSEPPPLRGQAKPAAGGDSFQRLRSARPTSSADARIGSRAAPPSVQRNQPPLQRSQPSVQRGQAPQPVGKAELSPPSALRRAPSSGGWTRRAPASASAPASEPQPASGSGLERAAPSLPRVRTVARSYESAPSVGFDRAPSGGFDRAPSGGFERAPSIGMRSAPASKGMSAPSLPSRGGGSAPSGGAGGGMRGLSR